MSRAKIQLLTPPRARWGQYWEPRTGAFVWGCVGPGCQVQRTMLAGDPGASWSGGACYGAACPPEHGLGGVVWKSVPWVAAGVLALVLYRSLGEIGARAT